jgi:hypothetical protein
MRYEQIAEDGYSSKGWAPYRSPSRYLCCHYWLVESVNADDFTKEEQLSRLLQLEQRVEELQQEVDQKYERIKELETRLRKYENPHTPPSKRRSGTDESPTDQDDEDDDVRTDGGTPGRKDGHDPEWRSTADPDEEVEATCDCCPECGEHFDESVGVSPRLVEEIPDHSHQKSPSTTATTTSATPVEQRQLRLTPTAPMRGSSG